MKVEQQFNFRNPLIMAAVMVTGMFLGYKMKGSLDYNNSGRGGETGNLGEIISLIQNKYVDPLNTDSTEMKAIDNLLAQLDPHSVYIPPQDLKQVDEDLSGEFEGVGIEYMVLKDTLTVTSVISGGPSESAGIQSGDQLVKINDSVIAGKKLSNDAMVKKLRGKSGTKVKVSLLRNRKNLKDITVTRGKIPRYSIDASYMLDATTGYIKINKFGETTFIEFEKALKEIVNNGATKLMLDLRDNPGGFLEAAVKIADEMIAGKGKIVYTKGKEGKMDTYNAGDKGMFEQGKIVVLIDEGSASAAEILSGSLQDYDRATIVGRRSFGKGLVQEQYPLSNGGAIRLTVARYYIPSGRCVQKDYSNGVGEYYKDVKKRFAKGELNSKDSITIKDSTIYKTMGGRTVYGGGGIVPDVFVPLTIGKYSESLNEMIGSSTLNEVENNFIINNKEEIKKQFVTEDAFVKNYAVPTGVLNDFILKCKAEGIKNTNLTAVDKQYVLLRIKAAIAKAIYGNTAQYKVVNAADDMVLKGMEQFK